MHCQKNLSYSRRPMNWARNYWLYLTLQVVFLRFPLTPKGKQIISLLSILAPTVLCTSCSGKKHGGIAKPRVLLAEIASCQLEYRYLAHLTGKAEYYRAVARINSVLQMSQNLRSDSLWATHWETENGTQVNGAYHPFFDHICHNVYIDHMSIGAWADSAVGIFMIFFTLVVELIISHQ